MEALSIEVVQKIAFESGLGGASILALALTSHTMHHKILGEVGNQNTYDTAQLRATSGIVNCMRHKWWRGARLALERGYGSPLDTWHVFAGLFRMLKTPLEEACREGEEELVRAILAHPEVDVHGGGGRELGVAIQKGHAGVVSIILALPELEVDRLSSLLLRDEENWAVLAAVDQSHPDVLRVLLEDGRFPPDVKANSPLFSACKNGNEECLRLLLDDGRVDPSVKKSKALLLAAKGNHPGVVRMLLDDGRVDPGVQNNAALRAACTKGFVEVVEALLGDPRINPSAKSNNPVRMAATFGHAAIVSRLLSSPSVDPSADSSYALRMAVKAGHVDIVQLLLDDGRVDVGVRGGEVVDLAVERQHTEIVDLLSTHTPPHTTMSTTTPPWISLPPELWMEIALATISDPTTNLPRTLAPLFALASTCKHLHSVVAIPMIWTRISHAISTTPLPCRPGPTRAFEDEFCMAVERDPANPPPPPAFPTSFASITISNPADDGGAGGTEVLDLLTWRVTPLAEAWVGMFPIIEEGDEHPRVKGLDLVLDPLLFAKIGAALTPLCACGDMGVTEDGRDYLESATVRHVAAMWTATYGHNGREDAVPVWGVLPPPGYNDDIDAIIDNGVSALSQVMDGSKASLLATSTCPWCGSSDLIFATHLDYTLYGFICLPHRHLFSTYMHWCW